MPRHAVPEPGRRCSHATRSQQVLDQEGLNVGYFAFNAQKPPFTDRRFRQALNYAVDKQSIIDAVFQSAGRIAKNPIPPTMWSYNENVADYAYDPEKAKHLLAEAGYGNGFETDVWAMPALNSL